jgi:alpha-D-xyloside xylohydrolase
MQVAFPDDPAVGYLDRQYMLGSDLLVAPVFTATGEVEFYLPAGGWTNYFTGEHVQGGRWLRETHGFDSLPLYVRDGAVLPIGARDDRPDYAYLDDLTLEVYPGGDGTTRLDVDEPEGASASFSVERGQGRVTAQRSDGGDFALRFVGRESTASSDGRVELEPPA